MNHGSYADVVYSLNNGNVSQLHIGNIDGTYTWDNQAVKKEQYEEYLNEAFNRESATEVVFNARMNELIEEIKNM